MIVAATDIKPPRLLILGGGALVSTTYLPALSALGWLVGAVVVEPSAAAANNLQQSSPKLQVWLQDFRKALARTDLATDFEAVVVALPNRFHEEACALALEHGLPVLCEKPLTLSVASCLRLAEKFEQAGRVLAVGMVRRLLPSVVAVREALAQGYIGDLVRVEIEHGSQYAWPSESGAPFAVENGGVLADMGIHYLDLAEHLAGELVATSYRDDWRGGVEANAEIGLRTKDGASVRIALSRTHNLRNTLIFQGTRGTIELGCDQFESCLWRSADGKLEAEIRPGQTIPSSLPAFEAAFATQFLNFAEAIQGKQIEYVTARQAAVSAKHIEWAYQQRSSSPAPVQTALAQPRPTLEPGVTVVTGGTGFIGINLVARLREIGFENITVPLRSFRSCAEVACYPVQLRRVDLLQPSQVAEAVAGSRYVFHLAYGRDGAEAAKVTIEGTRNVVEAAISNGAECVVILSTMYVLGVPETAQAVDESWPYKPYGGEYGTSKAKMEQWCLQRAKTSGKTRIVVLNPSCVYGPHGKTFTRMPHEMARNGAFGLIENGRGLVNYNYVGNLVDAMLLAAQQQQAHGERFIINDGAVSWREYFKLLLDKPIESFNSYTKSELEAFEKSQRPPLRGALAAIVRNPEVRRTLSNNTLTKPLINLARNVKPLRLLEKPKGNGVKPHLEGAKISLPPSWLADLFGTAQTVFSAAKAQRVLGWQPLVDITDGMRLTSEWLGELGRNGK